MAAAANLALYRRYRSAVFADIIGQDHVTVPLRQALTSGRINHAYLFSGPRGCGKTSSARILARSLNCAQGPTPDPCGVCDSCIELAPNGPGSIDVIEIDAASHNGVDDARDLRERAFFAPVRDRFKVYIIDEAHMVTTAAFNALLKLVEEPPDFLVFIFATTEPEKVLTTIRSRTHHYPFRLIPPAVMRAHLESICAAEGITVEPAVLPLVVRAGGGSARDSLSILDQLLAGAGPEGVTYARAVGLLGVTDSTLIDDMVDALAAGDAAAVYGTVDRVAEAGHDPRRFSVDLLDRFRDLILLDAVPDAGERGLVDVPGDLLDRMADQAARLGSATLTRFAEIVHTALIEMRGTTSPRLVLELLCARMMLPDAATDSAALLQRLDRLERRLTAGTQAPAPAGPAPKPPRESVAKPPRAPAAKRSPDAAAKRPDDAAAKRPDDAAAKRPGDAAAKPPPGGGDGGDDGRSPATVTPQVGDRPAALVGGDSAEAVKQPEQPPAGPGALDAAALRRLWPEVLNVINGSSKTIRALLDTSQVLDAAEGAVTIEVSAGLAKRLTDERNVAAIAAGLTAVVGGTWKVTVQPGGARGTGGSPTDRVGSRAGAGEPPREPDPRDDADYEPRLASPPVDIEAEAIKLVTTELGARRIDG